LNGTVLVLCLLFASLSHVFAAGAGQVVEIGTNLGIANVYGNGVPPDYNSVPAGTTDATGNTVNINAGGEIKGSVIGGALGNVSGTVKDNTVNIYSGGTVGLAYGGNMGSNVASAATNNTVNVHSGGTVAFGIIPGTFIYGGYANTIINGTTTATENTVNISAGSVLESGGGDLRRASVWRRFRCCHGR
jgi:hypothetical protein